MLSQTKLLKVTAKKQTKSHVLLITFQCSWIQKILKVWTWKQISTPIPKAINNKKVVKQVFQRSPWVVAHKVLKSKHKIYFNPLIINKLKFVWYRIYLLNFAQWWGQQKLPPHVIGSANFLTSVFKLQARLRLANMLQTSWCFLSKHNKLVHRCNIDMFRNQTKKVSKK